MRQFYSQNAHGSSALRITADEPQFRGAAPHRYVVEGFDTSLNRAVRSAGFVPRFREMPIIFATEGAPNDGIPDGVTLDALLAVVADHLYALVNGPSGSMQKQLGLEFVQNAREILSQDQGMQQMFMDTSPQFHYTDQRRVGAL